MKTLVLGLGNPILRDDGVGLRVAQEVERLLPTSPEIEIGQDYWGGLRLMERLIGFDRAIIIDAICTGAPPGTIHLLNPDDIPTQRSSSAHDVNLPTALQLGYQTGAHLPPMGDILLIGIEAADVQTFDENLSPSVEGVLSQAVEAVMTVLKRERETQ